MIGSGLYGLQSNGGNPATPQATGFLANFTGHNVVTTDSVTLPTNQDITLIITASLVARAGVDGDSAGSATSVANFQNTFSFATVDTGDPVFNLPDGYTANSISAAIFGNEYIGDVVPEPSTLSMLLGAAVIFVVGFRRRAGRVA